MSQIINTFYKKKTDDRYGRLLLITKEEDGSKHCKVINKPNIEFFITDDSKVNDDKLHRSLSLDQTKKVNYYYKDLVPSILKELSDPQLDKFYESCLNNKDFKNVNKIHLDRRVHGSDVNIEDHYIHRFLLKNPYTENNYPLTKLFFDIEVDGSEITGFPEAADAEAPVNIISGVYEEDNIIKINIFALKYDNEEFKNAIKRLKEIGIELREKYANLNMEIKIRFTMFNQEIALISSWFNFINELKPDFVLGWNTHSYDNVYLMNRISNLGYDPAEVMCPKEFPFKEVIYQKDTWHQDICDINHVFKVFSYSNYIDQMNLYANIRKPEGKKESYTLDYISEIELNNHKDEIDNIKTLHLEDYITFLKYNIQDTMLLYMLERKNKDIETLFGIAMITQTRCDQALKKTVCLKNFASYIYKESGRVLSNNRAKIYNKTAEPIPGAFVANPELTSDNGELMSDGKNSKYIYMEVIDQDLSSQYPNIIMSLNISPETLIEKVELSSYKTVIKKKKPTLEKTDLTFNLVGDVISKDYVNIGNKYLGYPDFAEMNKMFEEEVC